MNAATIKEVLRHPRSFSMKLNAPAMVTPLTAACVLLPDWKREDLDRIRLELVGAHEFHDQMSRRMFEVRRERFAMRKWNELVYMLVRATVPDIMVETGIFDGRASAVTLLAMRRNRAGKLISIDLPATTPILESTTEMLHSTLPAGRAPGWLIPEGLKDRHELLLGDSTVLLPQVLAGLDSIDIFQHDSLHTYDHMRMEFEVARPRIRYGGLLLSDDVRNNPAFHQQANGSPYVICDGFGGMRV